VPFGVEEFIAFAFSDSDKETPAVPIQKRDRGKQSRRVDERGKKRKSGEMLRDDRDENGCRYREKERMAGSDRALSTLH